MVENEGIVCYTVIDFERERTTEMTKIDVFSGFLGAGKTTLIKKLIKEAYFNEKVVLIENEFGEIGIDGGFMKEAGIQVNEMNSGCICCSLVGDFTASLQQVLDAYAPDRILIEPSGVGKLSDVIKAVQQVESNGVKLNSFTTVADAGKCKIYSKNFGEFYNDQLEHAGCIVLSRTGGMSAEKLDAAVSLVREKNPEAVVITTPWEQLTGAVILSAMEGGHSLHDDIVHLSQDSCPVCGHHHEHDEHHHHHHDEECDCHDHHHHHDAECDCHDHHHHHDEECDCHEHHHHHDGECDCHHHHHADEVFSSWGVETIRSFSVEDIRFALEQLSDENRFGVILRAKGIVSGVDGTWIHFDYVPGDVDVRIGGADVIGRLCVIGSQLCEDALQELFRV